MLNCKVIRFMHLHVLYHVAFFFFAEEKGENDAPCKEGGICIDGFAECVRGICTCQADYFLKDNVCGMCMFLDT